MKIVWSAGYDDSKPNPDSIPEFNLLCLTYWEEYGFIVMSYDKNKFWFTVPINGFAIKRTDHPIKWILVKDLIIEKHQHSESVKEKIVLWLRARF